MLCLFCCSNYCLQKKYRIVKSETTIPKLHIVLCAPKKTGKTTLIKRIIQEAAVPAIGSPMPVYGFQTKRFAGSDGINRIYMFPADREQPEIVTREAHYIGSTQGRVIDFCTETFDTYGTSLIRSAQPGGLLIMDEIGHLEKDANRFLQAILEALDGDIPVLASVRYTAGSIDYLEHIKHHPRVQLYMLTEENRDSVYEQVRHHIFEIIPAERRK